MNKLLFCLCLISSIPVFAADYPQRKPGLWQIQTSIEGLPGNNIKQCTDEETDAKMIEWGKNNPGLSCTKNDLTKEGKTYVSESDCTSEGTRMISKTVFSGDFNSKYSGVTHIKYDPPLAGRKEIKMNLTATWMGSCPADLKPGDIVMPNGMKMNINSMGSFGK